MFCGNCGKGLLDGIRFCANCGEKIEVSTSRVVDDMNQQKVAPVPLQTQRSRLLIPYLYSSVFTLLVMWIIHLVIVIVDFRDFELYYNYFAPFLSDSWQIRRVSLVALNLVPILAISILIFLLLAGKQVANGPTLVLGLLIPITVLMSLLIPIFLMHGEIYFNSYSYLIDKEFLLGANLVCKPSYFLPLNCAHQVINTLAVILSFLVLTFFLIKRKTRSF